MYVLQTATVPSLQFSTVMTAFNNIMLAYGRKERGIPQNNFVPFADNKINNVFSVYLVPQMYMHTLTQNGS